MDKITRATTTTCIIHGGHDNIQNTAGPSASQRRHDGPTAFALARSVASGRASVPRKVAENQLLRSNEFNRSFVLMRYYGYLRRNPGDPQDTGFRGWKFWLDKLDRFDGNFVNAEMVKAFISAVEYRSRFGQ